MFNTFIKSEKRSVLVPVFKNKGDVQSCIKPYDESQLCYGKGDN